MAVMASKKVRNVLKISERVLKEGYLMVSKNGTGGLSLNTEIFYFSFLTQGLPASILSILKDIQKTRMAVTASEKIRNATKIVERVRKGGYLIVSKNETAGLSLNTQILTFSFFLLKAAEFNFRFCKISKKLDWLAFA